jgi:hypothetical protein
VERSDTHPSSRHHAGVPDYRRNFTAGCGFFFERLRDVQQVMDFARAQPILRALAGGWAGAEAGAAIGVFGGSAGAFVGGVIGSVVGSLGGGYGGRLGAIIFTRDTPAIREP